MKIKYILVILLFTLFSCSKHEVEDLLPGIVPNINPAALDESMLIEYAWITPVSVGINVVSGKATHIVAVETPEQVDISEISASDYVLSDLNSEHTKICRVNAILDYLKPETNYYIYSYYLPEDDGTNEITPRYGPMIEIRTPKMNTLNVEVVDLGLSIKWRNRNILAETPLDIGGYYLWGNVQPTTFIDIEDNVQGVQLGRWSPGIPEINHNNICGRYPFDAAYNKLGANWRLPTYEEIKELLSQTTISRITANGCLFYVFNSHNGNQLWVPSSSYKNFIVNGNNVLGLGISDDDSINIPYFWTGDRFMLYGKPVNAAWALKGDELVGLYNNYAIPIRPVYVEK